MPLSFVIARYFAYAFAAVATAWLASFMALSAAINAGFVYEASWGPANCVSSRGFEQKEHRKLSSLSIGSAHAF